MIHTILHLQHNKEVTKSKSLSNTNYSKSISIKWKICLISSKSICNRRTQWIKTFIISWGLILRRITFSRLSKNKRRIKWTFPFLAKNDFRRGRVCQFSQKRQRIRKGLILRIKLRSNFRKNYPISTSWTIPNHAPEATRNYKQTQIKYFAISIIKIFHQGELSIKL